MRYIITALTIVICATSLDARVLNNSPRDTTSRCGKGGGRSLSIGSGGICIGKDNKDSSDKVFQLQFGMLDLGINSLRDNTQL